jgi:hypothetical protein
MTYTYSAGMCMLQCMTLAAFQTCRSCGANQLGVVALSVAVNLAAVKHEYHTSWATFPVLRRALCKCFQYFQTCLCGFGE